MKDLNAILRAVLTDPASDDPRLMYADLLLEQGTPRVSCKECEGKGFVSQKELVATRDYTRMGWEYDGWRAGFKHLVCSGTGEVLDTSARDRAEFIKVQIELARRDEPKKTVIEGGTLFEFDHGGEYDELRKREKELFAHVCREWFPNPSSGEWKWVFDGSDWPRNGCWFNRGFIDKISCTAETFLEHEAALIWHPTQKEKCTAKGCEDGTVGGQWMGICCDTCDGSRLVPRPCPDTAQPITKVIVTEPTSGHMDLPHCYRDSSGIWRNERWPDIEFSATHSGAPLE